MIENSYPDLKKGSFLIASPELEPSIFSRSIILLCEHTDSGSFGLIINKPLHVEIPEDIVDPNQVSNPNIGIRAGGPIQPNQMMLLHSSPDLGQATTLQVCDHVYLGGDLEFLQESIGKSSGPSILICFGYVGWGPTILEKEYLNGAWILSKADQNYVFHTPPDKLWQQVLRDMGGKYTTLSMIPEDLNLN